MTLRLAAASPASGVGGGRRRSDQGWARADAWLSCLLEGELEEIKREKHNARIKVVINLSLNSLMCTIN